MITFSVFPKIMLVLYCTSKMSTMLPAMKIEIPLYISRTFYSLLCHTRYSVRLQCFDYNYFVFLNYCSSFSSSLHHCSQNDLLIYWSRGILVHSVACSFEELMICKPKRSEIVDENALTWITFALIHILHKLF